MAEQLKNILFTEETIHKFADEIAKVDSSFSKKTFLSKVYVQNWEKKELKEKMHHVTECLHDTLPKDYKKALIILLKIAPQIKGFEGICLPDFVERYGTAYWDESLKALKEFTKYSTSEYGIRPFIIENQDKTMRYMLELSTDTNEHVRRFSSEGCRPRLPWAIGLPALKKDPSTIFPILENLKDDQSEYVRKSVANNLNDISKDHPELVLEICEKWQDLSKNTNWIIKHACRTLLKAGHLKAMLLFGYGQPNDLFINNLSINKSSLQIGDEAEFSFELESKCKKPTKIRVEYAVDYVKSSGKLSSKVFMIVEKEFEKGKHPIKRKISFKNMTTRKHHPGEHGLKIIVNGIEKALVKFMLKAK